MRGRVSVWGRWRFKVMQAGVRNPPGRQHIRQGQRQNHTGMHEGTTYVEVYKGAIDLLRDRKSVV